MEIEIEMSIECALPYIEVESKADAQARGTASPRVETISIIKL